MLSRIIFLFVESPVPTQLKLYFVEITIGYSALGCFIWRLPYNIQYCDGKPSELTSCHESSTMGEKPLNRAERRKRETRQRLLAATAKLLTNRSYADLTVRAITDEADVGYGTFYLHFADKDEIVWEIIAAIIKEADGEFGRQEASLSSPYREFMVLQIFFEFVQSNREQFLTVLGRNGSPTLAARYRDAVTELNMENLRRNRYQPNPMGVPLDFAANFFSGATLRLAVWWLENEIEYTPKAMAEMFFKLIYQSEPPEIGESD